MRRLFFLSFLFCLPAFAYDTTQFRLSITRENIHEQGPSPVGELGPVTVRYDNVGHCFLLGAKTDYPCEVKTPGRPGGLELYVDIKNLAKLVQDDLVFTTPQLRGELDSVLTRYAGSVEFLSPERTNPHPESVAIVPVGLLTPDSKTTYQLR